MDDVRAELQEVFRDVFKDPDLVLQDGMTAESIDGWDSLAHINLIVAMEKRLKVRFTTAEISRLKENDASVGRLLELLARTSPTERQGQEQNNFSSLSSRIRCRQIVDADVSSVVDLLTRGFPRRGRKYWCQALQRLANYPSPKDLPKYGYLLEIDNAVVGVLLSIFTTLADHVRCNVSAWYVDPTFRSFATWLTYQSFKHKGITYTNISPAPHVRPIIEAQGFVRYSAGQFVAFPLLSRSSHTGKVRILPASQDPDVPFDPADRDLLLAHMSYGCVAIWCVTSDRAYPFVFVPRVVKVSIPCFQLVYCSAMEDFIRFGRTIGWFLTSRGRPLVIIDANGPIPGLVGHYFEGVAPKYFKGPHPPRAGDLAYTEAAMFGI